LTTGRRQREAEAERKKKENIGVCWSGAMVTMRAEGIRTGSLAKKDMDAQDSRGLEAGGTLKRQKLARAYEVFGRDASKGFNSGVLTQAGN